MNKLSRSSIAILCLFAFYPSRCLFAESPAEVATALIEASKESDLTGWYDHLSESDIEIIQTKIGERQKEVFERQKDEVEKAFGRPVIDVNVFKSAELMLELSGYIRREEGIQAFALFFVKDSTVWSDKYAEVTVFLPVRVKWIMPFVKLSFIKEKDKWKFCQALSVAHFMSDGRKGDFNDYVKMYFNLFMGVEFDRADVSKIVKEEYHLPQNLSNKYYSAWNAAINDLKNDILLVWMLTGDKKAREAWKAEEDSNKTAVEKNYKIFTEILAGKNMLAQSQETVETSTDAEKYFQFIKSEFFRTVSPYRKFMAKFPDNTRLCAKAQYQIAEYYEYAKEYVQAEKEYLSFLKNYPHEEEAVVSRINLAKLYWEELGKQDTAIGIWKELDAIGKLPDNVPYKIAGTTVPETLVLNSEAGYRLGIVDFDVASDGTSIDVLYNTGSKSPEMNRLLRYKGSDRPEELFKLKIPRGDQDERNHNTYSRMQRVADGIWLYTSNCNGHALLLSAEGKPLKRLRDEGDQLTQLPLMGPEGKYPWKDSHEEYKKSPYWDNIHFGADSVYVFAANSLTIKRFDIQTWKLIIKSPPTPEVHLENYSGIVPTETGRILVVSPGTGIVLEYGDDGKGVKKIEDSRTGVQFTHILRTLSGDLLVADKGNHRISRYTQKGKYIGDFNLPPYNPDWISRIRVDAKDRLYVLVSNAQTQFILRFNADWIPGSEKQARIN